MLIKNKLKTLKLSDIKPYKKNAKIHPEHQIDTLKNSLAEYDYVEPLVVGTNNVIILRNHTQRGKQMRIKHKSDAVKYHFTEGSAILTYPLQI